MFSKLIVDKTGLIELLNYRVETVRIHKVDQDTSGLVVFIDDIDIEIAHYIGCLFSKLIVDKTGLIELLSYRVETVRIHKVDQVTSGLVVFIDDIDIEIAHYIG